MVRSFGDDVPDGHSEQRFARRDFELEDKLTRQLRENKEALEAKQARVEALRMAAGEEAEEDAERTGFGSAAEWRVGVEQPNPFVIQARGSASGAPRPQISEAMRQHPRAALLHSQTENHHQQHRQQYTYHQGQHQQRLSQNQSAPAAVGYTGRRSVGALTQRREEQERNYATSEKSVRDFSAGVNAYADAARQRQPTRGYRI